MSILSKIRSAFSSHGDEIWTSEEDIEQADLLSSGNFQNASGIIIGRNPYTNKFMIASNGENVLLVAPCRSGKSVNTVIPTALFWKDSFFAVDYKGELWNISAGYRKRCLHQTIMKFEPLCTDGSAAKWNPLSEIRFQTKEEREDADTIADLLVTGQSCTDAKVANAAKSALSRAILHLFHAHQSTPTLFDVSEFFLSSDYASIIDGMQLKAQTSCEVLRLISQALAIYRDKRMRVYTNQSDFSIRDLLDPKKKISLYVVIGCEEWSMRCQVERLLVSMIQKTIATPCMEPSEKPHLLLMLDDFIQLGYLPYCESALAFACSQGVQACLVAEDVSQLNKIYTKDNSIMGNCHVQIYFTPTNNESMKVLSDKLGDKTIQTVSHSDNGKIFGGSNSTSQQARKLMTPDEVSRMSQEKELVFVGGHRPIYGDKIRFYLEPYFKKRVQAPPPFSDTCTQY